MTTADRAAWFASLPRVQAGAAVLLRDGAGRVLLVEPNYRPGWALPGGTVEPERGETPRQAARREAREEIGLDVEPGRLLAVDWVPHVDRPPVVGYVYDGGVLGEERLGRIRIQEAELLSWRLVERGDLPRHLPGELGDRVLSALAALDAGTGAVELENGLPPR
ncbi:NUDIX domain-containing protein [Streptomyces genisteinicus]|uniref:NUDIX hydrolase n=1 Tax=Streptomyces genisteinicus TaxID=2768068 RepID=A0A7H0I0E5_9ACTN|nr:NUDIX hydrolase [Streptomyces genisteinicus]QNP66261.1 NUDIX hydrolase [Streptomyces genisteinicus]